MKIYNATLLIIIGFWFAPCQASWERVVDIPAPAGLTRVDAPKDSFTGFLRDLPLKADKQIDLYDGTSLPTDSYDVLAVIAKPLLFEENLEQCADFTMRLWADYLKQVEQLDGLVLFDFYGKPKPYATSGKSFRQYLKWHMAYSNSYSLKRGAKTLHRLSDLEPGDMFVQNDSEEGIGHVSMVLDMAENSAGLKSYLVGYSFMPAQQFHIERAREEYGLEGWFTAEGYQRYARSRFDIMGEPVLMRYQKRSDR